MYLEHDTSPAILVGHAASHTHTRGTPPAELHSESQVHGAAESQRPPVTGRLLLAATERLLQGESSWPSRGSSLARRRLRLGVESFGAGRHVIRHRVGRDHAIERGEHATRNRRAKRNRRATRRLLRHRAQHHGHAHGRGGVRVGGAEAEQGVPCEGPRAMAPDAAVAGVSAGAAAAGAGSSTALLSSMWAMSMPGTVLPCSSTDAAPTVMSVRIERAPLTELTPASQPAGSAPSPDMVRVRVRVGGDTARARRCLAALRDR